MKLCYSPTSPYVRKVMVLASELGLDERIERIATNPWTSPEALIADNPLSKVPTLTTDDGIVLYDSPVICDYLDSLNSGKRLIPLAGKARWNALRLQALGDGLLDAAVARLLERKRPVAQRSEDWMGLQYATIKRGLTALEVEAPGWGEALTIGQITVACALGYLAFRFDDEDWLEGHVALARWYTRFAVRPSMQATVPRDPA